MEGHPERLGRSVLRLFGQYEYPTHNITRTRLPTGRRLAPPPIQHHIGLLCPSPRAPPIRERLHREPDAVPQTTPLSWQRWSSELIKSPQALRCGLAWARDQRDLEGGRHRGAKDDRTSCLRSCEDISRPQTRCVFLYLCIRSHAHHSSL